MMSKSIQDILPLGDPRLYEVSDPVQESELPLVHGWADQLAGVMEEVRRIHGFGRGIAAPQLGIMKRMVYIDLGEPRVLLNPVFLRSSEEKMELWDDCMCFPHLLVRVERHRKVLLEYRDEQWSLQRWEAVDDESELIQHEVDHLDGILATMRALDSKSFRWRM